MPSYTLLYVYGAELRASESPDFLRALVTSRELIRAGAVGLSILSPCGDLLATHRDIVDNGPLIERLSEQLW